MGGAMRRPHSRRNGDDSNYAQGEEPTCMERELRQWGRQTGHEGYVLSVAKRAIQTVEHWRKEHGTDPGCCPASKLPNDVAGTTEQRRERNARTRERERRRQCVYPGESGHNVWALSVETHCAWKHIPMMRLTRRWIITTCDKGNA